jgi:hypothetical protein
MRIVLDLSKKEAEALLRGPDFYAMSVAVKSQARQTAEMKVLQAVTRAWNDTVASTAPRPTPIDPPSRR